MDFTNYSKEETYQKLINLAKRDKNIIGFILNGSRGKGFGNHDSDYDCTIIVKNDILEEYEEKFLNLPDGIELRVFSIESFSRHAKWGSDEAWDRYNWTHLKATVDKMNGKIQELIDEKGHIPAECVEEFISSSLDYYINQVYRSIKCLREGKMFCYRLEAAESITPLLNALFALHDNRLRPYYKYIRWEVKKFPLYKLPWTGEEFLQMIMKILKDGGYINQQEILREVKKIFCSAGYDQVFISWEGKDEWAMTFRPSKINSPS